MYTTVRLETKVKDELDSLKVSGNESYSNVIFRLVSIAKEEEKLSGHEIMQIEKSLADIKAGRVLPMKEAEKQWGI